MSPVGQTEVIIPQKGNKYKVYFFCLQTIQKTECECVLNKRYLLEISIRYLQYLLSSNQSSVFVVWLAEWWSHVLLFQQAVVTVWRCVLLWISVRRQRSESNPPKPVCVKTMKIQGETTFSDCPPIASLHHQYHALNSLCCVEDQSSTHQTLLDLDPAVLPYWAIRQWSILFCLDNPLMEGKWFNTFFSTCFYPACTFNTFDSTGHISMTSRVRCCFVLYTWLHATRRPEPSAGGWVVGKT